MTATRIELSSQLAPRRYKGASLDQRRQERRAQLIEAAIGVYGETGYRNATVKAVCRAAGLTERYFYESFPNSEALLAAAFGAVMDNLLAGLRMAADGAGAAPMDRARAVLTAYYTVLRDNPPGARVFLVEMFGVSPGIDALLRQALMDIAGVLAPRPATRADLTAPDLALIGVVGGVIQIALAWIASDYAHPVEAVVESAAPLCGTVLA